MRTSEEMIARIKSGPHWRLVVRPSTFGQPIASIKQARDAVEKCAVRIRGWQIPMLEERIGPVEVGPDWIQSFNDSYPEFWRMYQSSQFVLLATVRENSEARRIKAYRDRARQGLTGAPPGIDWDKVPGFIDINQTLYYLTELYEFVGRLCQKGVYNTDFSIALDLRNVKNFVLVTDEQRHWHSYYAAAVADLPHPPLQTTPAALVSDVASVAVDHQMWLMERFGWLTASRELFLKDAINLLVGRL